MPQLKSPMPMNAPRARNLASEDRALDRRSGGGIASSLKRFRNENGDAPVEVRHSPHALDRRLVLAAVSKSGALDALIN